MTGIEQDRATVRYEAIGAAQRPPDLAPAVRAFANDLPLRDGSVDAAMAILTVHHWDEGLRAGVRELRRVARDGSSSSPTTRPSAGRCG